MLGNLVTSGIAGVATVGWCASTGVPYAAALGVFTALMDLIPIVGSTLAGIVVSLVALSVSLPIAIATAVFYVVFRVAEDYLIVPRTMKFAVDVQPCCSPCLRCWSAECSLGSSSAPSSSSRRPSPPAWSSTSTCFPRR